MAKKSLAASSDAPDSFVKLHHWCETWSSRYQCPDGKRATRLFEKEFRAELERLGASEAAKGFPKAEGGREKSREGLRDRVQLGMATCYRLAVESDELTDGWADCCRSGITVPLPARPLRTAADLEQWIREWLNCSKLTETAEPHRALMLWTIFRQARLWFASHDMADDVPIVPSDCDAASEWIRSGQTKGNAPSQRDAERGLAKLLSILKAWKKRNESSGQRYEMLKARDDNGVARILAAIAQQQQTPKLKRGGQRKYDSKLKKRIREAWATGRYKRRAELDGLVGIVGVTAKMVLDADRKKP